MTATAIAGSSDEYSYDNTGNTTGDAQGRIFKYDAENKQYEVRNSLNQIIATAESIAVFTCDSGKAFEKLGSSNGTRFVSTNGGDDKVSSLEAQNQAAMAYTRSSIKGEVPQAARFAAFAAFVLNSSPDVDEGDTIEIRTLKP